MVIKSIQKTTLLDYPGKVACTIFLAGCNMKCSFCHNASLVFNYDKANFLTYEETMDFLESRKGKLDGVCITGGEPTINKDLVDFIKDIKSKGFLIKLDTNGTNPDMLEELIDKKLIDYVAMDIKNSFDKYKDITNIDNNIEDIKRSIEILKNSSIQHEFRTTVISIHDKEDLVEIAKFISPSKYFLQEFRSNEDVINMATKGVSKEDLKEYMIECNKYTKTFLRKK